MTLNPMLTRTYTKLCRLDTFEERFAYLNLRGKVGVETFGWDRPLNQVFYKSPQWRAIRNHVIYRDRGLDLGVERYEIVDKAIIHHMNPIQKLDLENFDPNLLDPEFLITVSAGTHRAIHYGDGNQTPRLIQDRCPGDTKLW